MTPLCKQAGIKEDVNIIISFYEDIINEMKCSYNNLYDTVIILKTKIDDIENSVEEDIKNRKNGYLHLKKENNKSSRNGEKEYNFYNTDILNNILCNKLDNYVLNKRGAIKLLYHEGEGLFNLPTRISRNKYEQNSEKAHSFDDIKTSKETIIRKKDEMRSREYYMNGMLRIKESLEGEKTTSDDEIEEEDNKNSLTQKKKNSKTCEGVKSVIFARSGVSKNSIDGKNLDGCRNPEMVRNFDTSIKYDKFNNHIAENNPLSDQKITSGERTVLMRRGKEKTEYMESYLKQSYDKSCSGEKSSDKERNKTDLVITKYCSKDSKADSSSENFADLNFSDYSMDSNKIRVIKLSHENKILSDILMQKKKDYENVVVNNRKNDDLRQITNDALFFNKKCYSQDEVRSVLDKESNLHDEWNNLNNEEKELHDEGSNLHDEQRELHDLERILHNEESDLHNEKYSAQDEQAHFICNSFIPRNMVNGHFMNSVNKNTNIYSEQVNDSNTGCYYEKIKNSSKIEEKKGRRKNKDIRHSVIYNNDRNRRTYFSEDNFKEENKCLYDMDESFKNYIRKYEQTINNRRIGNPFMNINIKNNYSNIKDDYNYIKDDYNNIKDDYNNIKDDYNYNYNDQVESTYHMCSEPDHYLENFKRSQVNNAYKRDNRVLSEMYLKNNRRDKYSALIGLSKRNDFLNNELLLRKQRNTDEVSPFIYASKDNYEKFNFNDMQHNKSKYLMWGTNLSRQMDPYSNYKNALVDYENGCADDETNIQESISLLGEKLWGVNDSSETINNNDNGNNGNNDNDNDDDNNNNNNNIIIIIIII
ncbi:conserved Plasmodium protein, unknown function, partial [Plasmodium malariae]